jgi:hypothetical protein
MPSLGNYDPLAARPANRAQINTRRDLEETRVLVLGRVLQFDEASRRRLTMTIERLEDGESVSWRFADNSEMALNRAQLLEMEALASQALPARVAHCYEIAQDFKARLEAGDLVTLRELDKFGL